MQQNKKSSSPQITFEQLPEAVTQVIVKLEKIEQLLLIKEPIPLTKAPVNTTELCKFLGLSQPTILRYRRRGILPYLIIGNAIRFDINKVVAALEDKNQKLKK